MDAIGLIKCLEIQITIQDLKRLGLTQEEIDGFLEFEWDSDIGKSVIDSVLEGKPND